MVQHINEAFLIKPIGGVRPINTLSGLRTLAQSVADWPLGPLTVPALPQPPFPRAPRPSILIPPCAGHGRIVLVVGLRNREHPIVLLKAVGPERAG